MAVESQNPEPAAAVPELPAEQLAGLDISKEENATETPAHRSHDPENNLKRTDPFQFGSRFLNEGDDVFEFNAWDHVETDDVYKEYAEEQYEKQRQSPVSDFDKSKSSSYFWFLRFFCSGTVMMKRFYLLK